MSKKLFMLLGLLVVSSIVLSACQPAAADASAVLHLSDTSDLPGLDPQIAEDVTSINAIESVFVNLTNVDLNTSEIVPEAADSWEISEDGLTYTFHLRSDIPWVKFDAATGEVSQVEIDGAPRFVTADDFVYAVTRACSPGTGGYYSGVIAPQIKGCSAVLFEEDPSAVIGATAPDAQTLVIELEFPAAFFLTMTPMWVLAATPQWAVEEHGEAWTEAANIVSSGRFVLADWQHGVRREFRRNPLFPAALAGSGNIATIVTDVVPDDSTSYALWLNGELETATAIPDTELQAHLEQFPDETDQIADLAVFYIGFSYDKPPFDDARVRAAFSAAFDRETFVRDVRDGQGIPMRHFAPPGIFGAPPIDEVGVGYNPEWANEQLAAAGYPNCEGFPAVTLLSYSGPATLRWIEFAQANWAENLGCSPDLIAIEQVEFAELLTAASSDNPTEDRPHMFTLGWGPDYGDENNWVGDVLWCEIDTYEKRECNATDDLIVEAREERDPARRVELYAQIEEAFFGENGEFPFAPIFLRIQYQARHAWLTRTPALFGGQQYYNWSLDVDAREAFTAAQ
jgi:oligopeptide transport system substrate-binding protein